MFTAMSTAMRCACSVYHAGLSVIVQIISPVSNLHEIQRVAIVKILFDNNIVNDTITFGAAEYLSTYGTDCSPVHNHAVHLHAEHSIFSHRDF
jgi:hypothetical protein